MSSSSKRKNLTPIKKLAAVRERLMDTVPISEICEKYSKSSVYPVLDCVQKTLVEFCYNRVI
jgi:transposase-like protein